MCFSRKYYYLPALRKTALFWFFTPESGCFFPNCQSREYMTCSFFFLLSCFNRSYPRSLFYSMRLRGLQYFCPQEDSSNLSYLCLALFALNIDQRFIQRIKDQVSPFGSV